MSEKGKKPMSGEAVVKNNVTLYDETGVPGNEYKIFPKGVVVPRATPTGGVEGGADIKVVKRVQEWDAEKNMFVVKDKSEVIVHAAGQASLELPDVVVPPPAKSVAETAQDAAQDPVEELLPSPEGSGTDARLDRLTSAIEKLLKDKTAAARVPRPDGRARTLVKYEGYFGTIEAAYKKVIVNASCVALIRAAATDDFFYSPPKDMEKDFKITVNMPGGPQEMMVLNPGLEFDYTDISETLLVLLRVS